MYTCQHVDGNPAEGIPIEPACDRCQNPMKVREQRHPTMRRARLRNVANTYERTPFLLKQAMLANQEERARSSVVVTRHRTTDHRHFLYL